MILFDAHIHLTDKEYSNHLQLILNTFRALKINACSVTVDIESSLRSLDLFKNNFNRDVVTQFIGIHPDTHHTKILQNSQKFLMLILT